MAAANTVYAMVHPPLFQRDPAAFFAEGCEADVLLVLEQQRSNDAGSNALDNDKSAGNTSSQPDAAPCAGAAAPTDTDSPAGQPVQDASRPAPAAAAASLTAVRMRANRMLLSVWSPVLKATINKAALQQQEQHMEPGAPEEQLHEGWEKLATKPTDTPAGATGASASASSSSCPTGASPPQQLHPKEQQQKKLLEVRLSTSDAEEQHAWWLAMCLIHPLSPTFGRPPVELLTPQLLKPLVDIGRKYAMPGLLLAAKGLLLEQGTQFGLGSLAPGQLDAAEWLVTADSIPGYEKVVTRCIEEVVRDCTLPPLPPPTAAPTATAAAGGATPSAGSAQTAPATATTSGFGSGFGFGVVGQAAPTAAPAAPATASTTQGFGFGGLGQAAPMAAPAAGGSATATPGPGFGLFGGTTSSSAAAAAATGFGPFGAPSNTASTAGAAFGRPAGFGATSAAFSFPAAAPPVVGTAAAAAKPAASGSSPASGTGAGAASAGGSGGTGGVSGVSSVSTYPRVEQLQDVVKQLRPETAAQLAASLANCLMVAAGKAWAGSGGGGGGGGGCEFKPAGVNGGWKCVNGGGISSAMEP